MRTLTNLLGFAAVILCFWGTAACAQPGHKDEVNLWDRDRTQEIDGLVVFSGRVFDTNGRPIADASVQLNSDATKTADDGAFAIATRPTSPSRYVLNIQQRGFRELSRVYDHAVVDGGWTLYAATVEVVNPKQAISVSARSGPESCTGSPLADIDWSQFRRQRVVHLVDSFNQLTDGSIPPQITEALEIVFGGTSCSPGITIRIPPGALVDENGDPPAGDVEVVVSTVDLYAPDAMPGDYSVQTKEVAGYMQSYGAGSVDVVAEGHTYQLARGATAQLTIPVDPMQLRLSHQMPETIPLLWYDRRAGIWMDYVQARLDSRRLAYVAEIDHFSAFNTDLIKTDQACIRIDGSGIADDSGTTIGSFKLFAVIPMEAAAPVVRNWDISPATQADPHLHVIINLPSHTWITLLPVREVAGDLIPYGIFGVNSGPPQTPTDPNWPPYPYSACQNEIALTDKGGDVEFVVDGTSEWSGEVPTIMYVLARGTDIYPVGPSVLYLFGLFDTGSSIVRIRQDEATLLGMGTASTSNPNQDVTVRVNGFRRGINPNTLGGRLTAPGTTNGAEAEVPNLRVGIRSDPTPSQSIPSLIGAPVANEVIALIDQSKTIERGPYGFCGGCTISAPDIRFFDQSDQSAPVPELTVPLERFGTTTPSIQDDAANGQRYFIKNVTFTTSTGSATESAAGYHFLFDTGTRPTIINTAIANDLGLPPIGSFDCWTSEAGNEGHELTSVEITGVEGSYVVEQAAVCVDVHDNKIITRYPNPVTPSESIKVDAVIGMNLFSQIPIIFNGNMNELGIGVAGQTQ